MIAAERRSRCAVQHTGLQHARTLHPQKRNKNRIRDEEGRDQSRVTIRSDGLSKETRRDPQGSFSIRTLLHHDVSLLISFIIVCHRQRSSQPSLALFGTDYSSFREIATPLRHNGIGKDVYIVLYLRVLYKKERGSGSEGFSPITRCHLKLLGKEAVVLRWGFKVFRCYSYTLCTWQE